MPFVTVKPQDASAQSSRAHKRRPFLRAMVVKGLRDSRGGIALGRHAHLQRHGWPLRRDLIQNVDVRSILGAV